MDIISEQKHPEPSVSFSNTIQDGGADDVGEGEVEDDGLDGSGGNDSVTEPVGGLEGAPPLPTVSDLPHDKVIPRKIRKDVVVLMEVLRVLMIQLSLQSSSRSLYRAKTTIEVFVTKKLKKSEMLSQTQECFELSIDCQSFEAPFKPETFPALLHYIGRSIVNQFFLAENYGLNWISFLNGYTKCCGRMPTSTSLIILLKVFQMVVVKSGATTRLQVESWKLNGWVLKTVPNLPDCLVQFIHSRLSIAASQQVQDINKNGGSKKTNFFIPSSKCSHLGRLNETYYRVNYLNGPCGLLIFMDLVPVLFLAGLVPVLLECYGSCPYFDPTSNDC
ncbi:TLDc [Artemisia annua]|uniref:TLDc n=1 Tax=Artemisia annua TaxID=35608 RepID=A0A2U1QNC5_ARTAN|nr:TLDc [Artemisia annua]